MSVVISGSSSGTITLDTPAVSGTNTATLPAATGTVMVSGNMPAFYAYAGANTTLTNSAWTKVLFNTKIFDTNNNFASSTFTPTVAGYYQLNTVVNLTVPSVSAACAIYKNGSVYSYLQMGPSGGAYVYGGSVSTVVYANGSTDYFEVYFFQNSSASSYSNGQQTTWFNGCLVRTA